jgi:DNA-binding NarL/FixJ family response regulator
MIRVLIVEDESWVRDSLRHLLGWRGSGAEVAAACATANEALRLVEGGLAFDLALVDLGLPDRPGVEVIRGLRRARPSASVVVFTIFDDAASVFAALKAGARGYILKHTPPEALLAAIQECAAGGAPMTPAIARMVVDALVDRGEGTAPHGSGELTRREIDVLTLLAKGSTYAAIAEGLAIGLGTVQTYVRSIYEKLEIASKAEAAVAAVKLGLV